MGSIDMTKKGVPVALVTLVAVNALMYLLLLILNITVGGDIASVFAVPADYAILLVRPWTLITYMFTQFDAWQMLFNMLWLWWLGQLLVSLRGARRFVAAYIGGGLAGALFFLIWNMFQFDPRPLLGSSCAVMSVMVCVAVLSPDRRFNVLFIGPVKLKWIVAVSLLLYAVSGDFGAWAGQMAHLGGVLFGVVIGLASRRIDVRKPKFEHPSLGRGDEELLNGLLDKVRANGYASLSPVERKLLIDITNKIGKHDSKN